MYSTHSKTNSMGQDLTASTQTGGWLNEQKLKAVLKIQTYYRSYKSRQVYHLISIFRKHHITRLQMSIDEILEACNSPALPVRKIHNRLGFHSLDKNLTARLNNYEEKYFFSN